jgi:DNA polymerase-4
VQLKVRFADFTTLTRAQTLPDVTDITAEIWRAVHYLFSERLPRPLPPVRLVGVGISNFGEEQGAQQDLFASPEKLRQRTLDSLLDEMHSRFGKSMVSRGKLPGKQ